MSSSSSPEEALEILDQDQAYINEQFSPLGGLFGEEITCQCPVYVTRDDKNLQLVPRILVIGKYKLVIIKKAKFKKTVKKSIHLYDLVEICEPSQDKLDALQQHSIDTIEIKYKDTSNNTFSSFLVKSPAKTIETIIIKTIGITTYAISRSFPKSALLNINLPSSRFQPMQFDHDIGVDGKGIGELYIAHSHYFNRKATLDYLRHLETLYLTRYPVLNFSDIPGIDATCSLGFNLFTCIISLRHNPFIRSLKISGVPHINVISSIGEMMQTNTSITELEVTNLLTEQSFAPLGHALMINDRASALQILNLSNNLMSYESIISLCEGLANFNHSLTSLNLSKCNIPPRGIKLLFEAFEKNFAMSLTLEELNLSENRFQDSGTSAFSSWLSKSRGHNSLLKLYLSQTSLNMSIISPPLRILEKLCILDLSGNNINISSARLLAVETLECIPKLVFLNLSSCGLVGNSLEMILLALRRNSNIKNLNLNLSNNSFAAKTCQVLVKLLPDSHFIAGLDLSFNSFVTRQLIEILGSTSQLKSLVSLDIGNNPFSSNDEYLIPKVVEFMTQHPNIVKFGIGSADRQLGSTLHPLIQCLNFNKSIQVLNISGNGMNDHGACLLADCLRNNKSLKKIFIYGNQFTSVGWQSLASPFIFFRNTSVEHIDLPVFDQPINVSDSNMVPLSPIKRAQLQDTFAQIQMQLNLNKIKLSASQRFGFLPQDDPPIYVKPPATIPDHLSGIVNSTSAIQSAGVPSGSSTIIGKMEKITLSNTTKVNNVISSIFSKPINTLVNISNDIASLKSPTLHNHGNTNGGGNPELEQQPSRPRNKTPTFWNEDEWSNSNSTSNVKEGNDLK
ncbi:hypothetical protein CYY_001851 [Polysphondylium violaceum]|uniref:Leucine-rich repeat-containing protein n=1 Tax=Polysphondylium violaceum TaxID=133409 RepID=A0A8J4PZ28_9MYCE|nr:hypothetical protein CYY_001851 [Polysphondylium violaceum]